MWFNLNTISCYKKLTEPCALKVRRRCMHECIWRSADRDCNLEYLSHTHTLAEVLHPPRPDSAELIKLNIRTKKHISDISYLSCCWGLMENKVSDLSLALSGHLLFEYFTMLTFYFPDAVTSNKYGSSTGLMHHLFLIRFCFLNVTTETKVRAQ